jgi:hypothetical protein
MQLGGSMASAWCALLGDRMRATIADLRAREQVLKSVHITRCSNAAAALSFAAADALNAGLLAQMKSGRAVPFATRYA